MNDVPVRVGESISSKERSTDGRVMRGSALFSFTKTPRSGQHGDGEGSERPTAGYEEMQPAESLPTGRSFILQGQMQV